MAAPRRFDHDAAIQAVRDGETIRDVATAFGVTYRAIHRLVTPGAIEQDLAAQRRFRAASCETCGGYACALVTGKKRNNPDGRVLCASCRSKERRSRFRFDEVGVLTAIRCNSRDCANGERWQPPSQFAGHPRFRDVRPQGIHGICRSCNTRMKRRWREAQLTSAA